MLSLLNANKNVVYTVSLDCPLLRTVWTITRAQTSPREALRSPYFSNAAKLISCRLLSDLDVTSGLGLWLRNKRSSNSSKIRCNQSSGDNEDRADIFMRKQATRRKQRSTFTVLLLLRFSALISLIAPQCLLLILAGSNL